MMQVIHICVKFYNNIHYFILPCTATCIINTSPSSQYYGGDKTKPAITCIPNENCTCDNNFKWFFGPKKLKTPTPKYSTSVNMINNFLTLTINNANESDAGYYHCQCNVSGKAVNSSKAHIAYKSKHNYSAHICYQVYCDSYI